jgi:hypothetical protein
VPEFNRWIITICSHTHTRTDGRVCVTYTHTHTHPSELQLTSSIDIAHTEGRKINNKKFSVSVCVCEMDIYTRSIDMDIYIDHSGRKKMI